MDMDKDDSVALFHVSLLMENLFFFKVNTNNTLSLQLYSMGLCLCVHVSLCVT